MEKKNVHTHIYIEHTHVLKLGHLGGYAHIHTVHTYVQNQNACSQWYSRDISVYVTPLHFWCVLLGNSSQDALLYMCVATCIKNEKKKKQTDATTYCN